jgi:hypothetical protein
MLKFMAVRMNADDGEPLERFLKRMLIRWDAALARIDALERKTDHMLKALLRREARDQERWKEQQERWKEQQKLWEDQQKRWEDQQKRWEDQQKRWEDQQKRWEENQRRWEENQKEIRAILARLIKS